jgi:hypothetical protein
MYLYRPRGVSVDRYLQADEEGEKGRDEIPLDDLDGFTVDQQRSDLRPWTEDMVLPLEPVIVSSQRDMQRALIEQGGANDTYTAIDNPT